MSKHADQFDYHYYYSDDPVDEFNRPSKRKLTGVIAFLILLAGGTNLVQTTLAANISLNSGSTVEFGQGITSTTACSGATNLTLTPNASFTNASSGGNFYFSSVKVSGIPADCNGNDFTINAYGNSSNTPLALFNSTSSNVVVYSNSGTFEAGAGGTGFSVLSGSGTFTVTFDSPVAVSSTVFKLSIQSGPHALIQNAGATWTSRTPATGNNWMGVTYGNGTFVAVSYSGTGNRVMTSPDGINWTSQASAADNSWYSVTFGNGTFVAISYTGTGNRVMTSPDGVTWTSRTSASDNNWYGLTYGNGLFVAVASSGTGNRVMTSPDGITWTSRTSAADNNWRSVVYGNGVFVAVAQTGTGNRVMTSPDGISWTSRTSAADNQWWGITYGNGTFVAVSINGTGNRVMTSN
jgi:hypothetical protein